MDTKKRTIIKAIVWNIIGMASMLFVGFVVTGSLGTGGAMAVVNSAIGLSMYVIYERVWSRVKWGRVEVSTSALAVAGITRQ